MDMILVPLVALLASGLTLFSGFGLGTLLLPAFLLFFPTDVSVALTAIVHFLNNVFKLFLLGRHAVVHVVLRFGGPALVASFFGALALTYLADLPELFTYELGSRRFAMLPVNAVMGLLIVGFAIVEGRQSGRTRKIPARWLPVGGVLSGFFGGISGHQGAFRSAFLLHAGLSKESFIATGVVIACIVDVSRMSVYAAHLATAGITENLGILVVSAASAIVGAYAGSRFIKKVTMVGIQRIVAVTLVLVGLGLATGVISQTKQKEVRMFSFTCTSYKDKESIPTKHAYKTVVGGQNISPGFTWFDPPVNVKSFALSIVDPHPVANNWVHWLVVNIPLRERTIVEGASRTNSLPAGSKELMNSFGELGYGGPAPPKGTGVHPYVATLYALSIDSLKLGPKVSLRQFHNAIEGKVIAELSVTGMYERK